MSRVNENREAQRAQAERQAADQNKTKSDGKKFSKAMAQKQPATLKQAVMKQAQAKAGGQSALVARQGFAGQMANKLAQANKQLDNKQTQTKSSNRSQDLDSQRTESTESGDKDTSVRLDSQDKLGAIKRDDNTGAFQGGSGQSSGGEPESKDKVGAAQGGVGSGEARGVEGAKGPAAAHTVQIPQEVLQKLVDQVRVGVTPEGLSTFQIQLKDDVLRGATISVTAQDGKVKMSVDTDNPNIRRLFQASEGQLARSMGHKGMSLDSLVINQRR